MKLLYAQSVFAKLIWLGVQSVLGSIFRFSFKEARLKNEGGIENPPKKFTILDSTCYYFCLI
jgi:hypothetical protein